jgi:competence protein ComEC
LALLGTALLGAAALGALRGRAGVAACCAVLALPHFVPWLPSSDPARLELAAVGHGQMCLAVLPDGARVIVDCGQLGNSSRSARAAAEALRPSRRADLLIATHAHHDHTGGVLELLQLAHVATAVLPAELLDGEIAGALRARGARVTGLAPGEARTLRPGVHAVRPAPPAADINDSSIFVHLDLGAFRALLTGDALEQGVRAWLEAGARPAEVLVLPHHGSHHEALPELLAAVRPLLALVSNRPAPAASAQGAAAQELGVRVLETGRVGTIVIAVTAPGRTVVRTAAELPLR